MRVSLVLSPDLAPAHRRAVRAARLGPLLRHAGDLCGVAARAGLTVRLTGDDELRALNARFRHVDDPTDVLAFPADHGGYVGDLAVSVPRALAQRPNDGAAELRLLAVHGLLHCLGHDHAAPDEAATMTEHTRRLLPGEAVPDLVPAEAGDHPGPS